MPNPILVALDTIDISQAVTLCERLDGLVGGVKLGLEFVSANGPAGVEAVTATGQPLFLDLKFHDIPNTVAAAVRAVTRLPRARAIVLAGALMGGDIEKAVREVREQGLLVVSLNMAGSVPDAADFVVTDPVQAGVMAVMAVADTAAFQSDRLKRRVF